MNIIEKFRDWCEQKSIQDRFEDEEPNIIYDYVLTRSYIHPYYTDRRFYNVELLAEKLCHECLCYEFQIGNEYRSHHELSKVIQDAYNYGNQFYIPPECELDYSEQELHLLRALAAKGETDRRIYRRLNGLSDITMTIPDTSDEDVILTIPEID